MAPIRSESPDVRRALPLAEVGGVLRLLIDATASVTQIVEAMHHTVLHAPPILGQGPKGRTRGITGLVYRSIEGTTSTLGMGLDALLNELVPRLGAQSSSSERLALLAALNGVLGDHLERTNNPLALTMSLCTGGLTIPVERQALASAIPTAGKELLLLIHGLCMSDVQWARAGHDHGAALARDLGFTPVYLRYNSGRHISNNGRALSELMQKLVHEWPVPLERIVIVAHSMGGLVARSAIHQGELSHHAWVDQLDDLVLLGTPHHGSHLERGGHFLQATVARSPYSAPLSRLGRLRSAGVTDLRHGNLLDRDWADVDRFERHEDLRSPVPLPTRTRCYAVAASLDPKARKLSSDGLVPVWSALGQHQEAERTLEFGEGRTLVVPGRSHFDLLSDPEVYAAIKTWLSGNLGAPETGTGS